ncbi:MAG TPA: chorismate-binding protein [Flavobacteriaceae bacterium]|nr:chorismate-binding protein [Flavobacteriaceae bacterium]
MEKKAFEILIKQYSNKLPFVVFRKPHSTVITVYLQHNTEVYTTENFTETGFVFAPFNLENKAVLIPEQAAEIRVFEWGNIAEEKQVISSNFMSDLPKKMHLALVQKGIDTINAGKLTKIVLSRTEEIEFSGANPLSLFNNLVQAYQDAFVYCWYHPKIGLWLGATPEILLTTQGTRFSTMSLAGTKPYEGSLQVHWSQKEITEQQIVTDYIVNGLKSLTTTLSVQGPKTVKAGNVVHLQTQISGILKTFSMKGIIQLLHPTPAVCGFPKEDAKQFILQNEGYNREYYTGFLGELNIKVETSRNRNKHNIENNAYTIVKQISNLFVNLRCVQLKENKAMLYVGGGITSESNPEHEWEETIQKSTTIKSCL